MRKSRPADVRVVFAGLVIVLLASLVTSTDAAEERGKRGTRRILSRKVYTDPKAALETYTFSLQGEYAGVLIDTDGARRRFGVQVIGRAGGKFDAVAYRVGLPGAGWDHSTRMRFSGVYDDKKAEFGGWRGGATIEDGKLTVRAENGLVIGRLERVARRSPTLGAEAPEGAVVLFDGKTNDFQPGREGSEILVTKPNGFRSQYRIERDCRIHAEFMLPYKPHGRGQGRGNSGFYIGRHELQVLDTFGLDGKKDECGGFCGRRASDINMAFPPLTWQTYDVDLRVARYAEDGKQISPLTMTVRHNGVIVHDRVPVAPKGRKNSR